MSQSGTTLQITLSQADDPAEAITLRKEATELLEEMEPQPVGRLSGVTTPNLAAYRTWRRPEEDGARARLEWARRTYRASQGGEWNA